MTSSISPIFSGASNFLTRILSYLYILITLKASEIPTVKGRPSGIATTIKTTIRLMVLGSPAKNTLAAESSRPILKNNEIINSTKIIAPAIKANNVK
jgi:hypothetical protein